MTQVSVKTAAAAVTVDYFALLGLPSRFDVDVAEIEQRYLAQSRELHPDRFVNAPAGERVAALQRFTRLNDAYNTLRRPVPRAEYLLARAGVTIGDNEALDPTFLMEILEQREELADAGRAGDRAAVARLEAVMQARRTAAIASLSGRFAAVAAAGDAAARAAALGRVKQQLILLRYIDRFLEECEDPDED